MEPQEWLKRLYARDEAGRDDRASSTMWPHRAETRDRWSKTCTASIRPSSRPTSKAGFVLEESSDLLRNPADDHTLLVFDEKIRGKTDRFMYQLPEAAMTKDAEDAAPREFAEAAPIWF